jgi:hypothetical protein
MFNEDFYLPLFLPLWGGGGDGGRHPVSGTELRIRKNWDNKPRPQDGEGKGEVEDLLHSLVYILFCPTQEINSPEAPSRSNLLYSI